jgi:5-methylcytosine-specific restriction endonuclease McrA
MSDVSRGYVRKKIPQSLRESVWVTWCGEKFKHKCYVRWCETVLTPFSFEVGHNVPVSCGGCDSIDNLMPICSKCNKSMSNVYTIEEYSKLSTRSFSYLDTFKYESGTTDYH